jgi:hypothetical protein
LVFNESAKDTKTDESDHGDHDDEDDRVGVAGLHPKCTAHRDGHRAAGARGVDEAHEQRDEQGQERDRERFRQQLVVPLRDRHRERDRQHGADHDHLRDRAAVPPHDRRDRVGKEGPCRARDQHLRDQDAGVMIPERAEEQRGCPGSRSAEAAEVEIFRRVAEEPGMLAPRREQPDRHVPAEHRRFPDGEPARHFTEPIRAAPDLRLTHDRAAETLRPGHRETITTEKCARSPDMTRYVKL